MKEKIKGLIPYIVILVAVIIIRNYIITPVRVNGSSMDDTLNEGDILILNKLDSEFKRHDIVVLDKEVIGDAAIKRIIGMPGETILIENGKLYINDKIVQDDFDNENLEDMDKIILSDDEYFVMGDNRSVSLDSRSFGAVSKELLEGTTTFRLYPFSNFGSIE